MQYFKLPQSISDKEALLIVQSQGFNTIVSITHDKNGNKLIQAM